LALVRDGTLKVDRGDQMSPKVASDRMPPMDTLARPPC